MKCASAIIARLWLGISPAFGRIEIENQLYSTVDFWGTGLRAGHPGRGPDKASHNPAPDAVAVPDLPANHDRYSSRAVGAWSPEFPATSLSFCAIFAPASRPNSFVALSPLKTVAGKWKNTVFTYTHYLEKIICFSACAGLGDVNRFFFTLGKRVVAASYHIAGFAGQTNVRLLPRRNSSRPLSASDSPGFFRGYLIT